MKEQFHLSISDTSRLKLENSKISCPFHIFSVTVVSHYVGKNGTLTVTG